MAKKSNSNPKVVWREARIASDADAQAAEIASSEIPVVSVDDPKRGVEGLEAFIDAKDPKDPFVRATFEFSTEPEVRSQQVAALRFALAAFLKVYPGSAQLVGTAQSCPPCEPDKSSKEAAAQPPPPKPKKSQKPKKG